MYKEMFSCLVHLIIKALNMTIGNEFNSTANEIKLIQK